VLLPQGQTATHWLSSLCGLRNICGLHGVVQIGIVIGCIVVLWWSFH